MGDHIMRHKKWEYKVVTVDTAGGYGFWEGVIGGSNSFRRQGDIDDLGAEGWELVVICFRENTGEAFFKRPAR